MNGQLFDNTKLAAYFLWEHSGCENALNLWYCAEDLASYFERESLLDDGRIRTIMRLAPDDLGYMEFIRNIAYRIFVYANIDYAPTNWYMAEHLIAVGEWVRALTDMAALYRKEKSNYAFISELRSQNVRAYYDEQTLHDA